MLPISYLYFCYCFSRPWGLVTNYRYFCYVNYCICIRPLTVLVRDINIKCEELFNVYALMQPLDKILQ
jgi:hypothetical protein